MSPDDLMARAAKAAGLTDFGEDEQFHVGLRVLLDAAANSGLSDERIKALSAGWQVQLEKRLQLVDHRKKNPEIAKQKIEGPIAVIGLPRTGTTTLVDLLAQDPAARAPLQWETANLFPPAAPGHWRDDPRIDALEAQFQAASTTNPIVALGLHTFGARLPDECNSFMAMGFWSPNLAVATLLPQYVEWLRFARPQRPYRVHRWILQHLQAHGPAGRWVLKSPFHAFAPAALLEEYPDVMMVQTHRDPVELLASNAGLISTIRGFGPGDPGRAATGREQALLWGTGVQRCLSDRCDPAVDARVLDMSHHALIEDPIGGMQTVYKHFDLPFTAEAEQRARTWIANPAQHKSSVRFTLEDFGLTDADIEAAFGPYRERFSGYF